MRAPVTFDMIRISLSIKWYFRQRSVRDRDAARTSNELSLLSWRRMIRLIPRCSSDLLWCPHSLNYTHSYISLLYCRNNLYCRIVIRCCIVRHLLIVTALTCVPSLLTACAYAPSLSYVPSLTYAPFLSKVGEGLCPRGGDSSTAMSIQTAALGNDGDIFVGGSFESRVWDGHHFVNVYHVAHFDGMSTSTFHASTYLICILILLMHSHYSIFSICYFLFSYCIIFIFSF